MFSDPFKRLRASCRCIRLEAVLAGVARPRVDQSLDAKIRGRVGNDPPSEKDRRNEGIAF